MLFSVVSFQKYGFVTCIRVIAILTLIRQLCKPILHESKTELHEFRANKQTFCAVTNCDSLARALEQATDRLQSRLSAAAAASV